ncbi:myosin-like protein [Homoserinimonas aerilata]|uniref:Myosin-like protein n=1 Tax=Homoserinimonas aerilata TaxID=1162970 RepID=A0A542Y1H7_9MICO|nr:DUF5666 domain-containing protein [Homoserinimonas aerilata]TQL41941.1 myosin-like protein [Homoserinimonas aerilata]
MTDTTTPAATETAVLDATASAPKTGRRWTRHITPALGGLALLVIGFFGGLLVGQNSGSTGPGQGNLPGGMSSLPEGMNGGSGGGVGGGVGGPGGFTSGTITSVDGDTITLELSDGSTVTVTAGSDTTITTTEESSVGELAEGDTLTVVGETDDDGTIAATSISEGERGFGGFSGGATPSN